MKTEKKHWSVSGNRSHVNTERSNRQAAQYTGKVYIKKKKVVKRTLQIINNKKADRVYINFYLYKTWIVENIFHYLNKIFHLYSKKFKSVRITFRNRIKRKIGGDGVSQV